MILILTVAADTVMASSNFFEYKAKIGDEKTFEYKKFFYEGKTEHKYEAMVDDGTKTNITTKKGLTFTIKITTINDTRGPYCTYPGYFPRAPAAYGKTVIHGITLEEMPLIDLYLIPITDDQTVWDEWVRNMTIDHEGFYRHPIVEEKSIQMEGNGSNHFGKSKWDRQTGWLKSLYLIDKATNGTVIREIEISEASKHSLFGFGFIFFLTTLLVIGIVYRHRN